MTTANIEVQEIPKPRNPITIPNNKADQESRLFWIKAGNICSIFIDIQHMYYALNYNTSLIIILNILLGSTERYRANVSTKP